MKIFLISKVIYTDLVKHILNLETLYGILRNTIIHIIFSLNEVLSGEVIDDKIHLNVYEVFNYTGEDDDTTRYERWKEYILVEVIPNEFQILKINIQDTNKNKD